jgi:rhamnogalacturonan acetylesterase
MMQFGHNEGSPIDDNQRARGTIKGAGDETEEIDNSLASTHTVAAGAKFNAQCVVDGLKAINKCPLADYLVENPGGREPA